MTPENLLQHDSGGVAANHFSDVSSPTDTHSFATDTRTTYRSSVCHLFLHGMARFCAFRPPSVLSGGRSYPVPGCWDHCMVVGTIAHAGIRAEMIQKTQPDLGPLFGLGKKRGMGPSIDSSCFVLTRMCRILAVHKLHIASITIANNPIIGGSAGKAYLG